MGHIGSTNKVSTETARAFRAHRPLRMGNTETDGKVYKLHENVIAENDGGPIVHVSLRGWDGPVTRARLNAIAHEYGYPVRFGQHQHKPIVWHTGNGAQMNIDSTGWYFLDDLLHGLNGIAGAKGA